MILSDNATMRVQNMNCWSEMEKLHMGEAWYLYKNPPPLDHVQFLSLMSRPLLGDPLMSALPLNPLCWSPESAQVSLEEKLHDAQKSSSMEELLLLLHTTQPNHGSLKSDFTSKNRVAHFLKFQRTVRGDPGSDDTNFLGCLRVGESGWVFFSAVRTFDKAAIAAALCDPLLGALGLKPNSIKKRKEKTIKIYIKETEVGLFEKFHSLILTQYEAKINILLNERTKVHYGTSWEWRLRELNLRLACLKGNIPWVIAPMCLVTLSHGEVRNRKWSQEVVLNPNYALLP
ncbi:hypothetical protein OSB04_001402 [Centaurea solstitialis]|uniref:Uncharacterized protein n=1 Tax=Centaurea solstitialis TaxID=347529 RepID=A0AA38U1H4_9ASTR|nr:hypothetical protein OSB04_001402 [Centaurea solstitialis]